MARFLEEMDLRCSPCVHSRQALLKMSKDLKKSEEARLAKRKEEELGPEGLEQLKKKLEEAKLKNDQPIPPEVLDQWPVPGTESIHFIESTTARSGNARSIGVPSNTAQQVIDKAPKGLPLHPIRGCPY